MFKKDKFKKNELMTKEQAFEKLGIKDYSELNEKNFIEFSSMLEKLEPEVAKEVINQFPNFKETISNVLSTAKEFYDKTLDSNSRNMENLNTAYTSVIDSIRELLKRDDLNFEERKWLIEKCNEILREQNKKDTENKDFTLKMFYYGILAIFGAVLGTVATITGGKISIPGNPKSGNNGNKKLTGFYSKRH